MFINVYETNRWIFFYAGMDFKTVAFLIDCNDGQVKRNVIASFVIVNDKGKFK